MRVTKTIDLHYWLDNPEAFSPKSILLQISECAKNAVSEYERVVDIRKNTVTEISSVEEEVEKTLAESDTNDYDKLDKFVATITLLRNLRGKVIGLKGLRYADMNLVNSLETRLEII